MLRVITLLLIALLLCPIALAMTSDGRGNMLVPSPRNLGVSTKNVSAKLTVNGTALFRNKVTIQDGSQLAGYILLSDANGKGTWTNPASIPSNDLWTDAGTFLRPSSNSGARTVGLGGTTRNSLDLLLGANGEAVFNQQKNNSDFRIAGQTNDNLFFTDASVNRIGVANASPVALLDVGNGTANEINGIDDLIVADDLEVDDTLFAFEFNGGTFYGSGAGVTNYAGAPIGPEGAIQYKDGTYMNSSVGFEWRKSSNRLGLGKTNSDSLLDINGASTIRQLLCPAGFNGGGGGAPPLKPYLASYNGYTMATELNLPINKPISTSNSDLLLAVIHYSAPNQGFGIGSPGWTMLSNTVTSQDINDNYYHYGAVLYKIANSEPSNYEFDFTPSLATFASGIIMNYKDTDPISPIDAYAATNGSHNSSPIISPNLNSFTADNHTVVRALTSPADFGGPYYQDNSSSNGYVDRIKFFGADYYEIDIVDKNGTTGSISTESHNMLNSVNQVHTAHTIALKGIGGGGGSGAPDYPGCAKENGGSASSYGRTPKYIDHLWNGSDTGGTPSASSTVQANKPAATQVDDLMIALILAANQNADILSTPSGWQFLAKEKIPFGGFTEEPNLGKGQSWVYYKTAGASEPDTYNFTLDESSINQSLVSVFNGASLSNPISHFRHRNGSAMLTDGIDFLGITGFTPKNGTVLRLATFDDDYSCNIDTWKMTLNGSRLRFLQSISWFHCESPHAFNKQIVSLTENLSLLAVTPERIEIINDTYPLTEPRPYSSYTLYIAPKSYGGGGGGNYTFPQSFTPDPNSMVMWQGVFDNNGDVGDVSAEINNSSIIKGFTLIDFDGIQNNQDPEFNGLTLNGLVANRLVITDSNKKLSTTSSVILNNNNVGISSLSPSSKLDVAALMTTKTFQIKSGAVNNYILRSDINGDSSWVAGSSVFNSAAGNDTEVQFNSAGVFAGNPNLTWASSRLNASNFSADNGSSSVPRYTFSGSNTSGVFSFSNNHLDYTSAGLHTISLDANGNVGLRNNSPVARLDINGSLAFKSPALINLTSVSSIPNSHGFIRVQGSGAPVQLSSSPQISTGVDGQLMVLKGSHNTNTLNLISKNGVTLNESTEFKMGQKDLIFLFFDADDNEWIEMGRSDN